MTKPLEIRPSLRAWYREHRAAWAAVVLDIDGCLMVSRRPVPGAADFLRALRADGMPVALLTNDGDHSVREKRAQLARAGLRFREQEITSCAHGLEELAVARGWRGRRFFVMGSLGRPDYARRAGLRVTRRLAVLESCAGVIVGERDYAWEPVINGVVNFLRRRPDRPLIVPNPDEFFPVRNGDLRVAAGGVARFIRRVLAGLEIGINPIYLGKPYTPIFEHNHAALERRAGSRIARDRVLMVGDSLASDVRGAVGFGYRSALLLTGVENAESVRRAAVRPHEVFRGF